MAGFLGCGSLYFNRVVGGVSQGLLPLGNATKFGIKENTDLKQRTSRQCATNGSPLESVYVKKPADVSVALDDLNKDNLAMIFLGTASVGDASQVVVATEAAIAPVAPDGILQLANANLDAGTLVVKNTGGATTYDINDDYAIVSAAAGLIRIVSGGAISPSDVLEIDYTAKAYTASKVTGGTTSTVKGHFLLIGTNLADDKGVRVSTWDADVAPTSEVDFLSEDFTTLELSGTANIDAAKGNAYEVVTDIVNA